MKKDRDHHCPTCGKPLPRDFMGWIMGKWCNKMCELQWKRRGRR